MVGALARVGPILQRIHLLAVAAVRALLALAATAFGQRLLRLRQELLARTVAGSALVRVILIWEGLAAARQAPDQSQAVGSQFLVRQVVGVVAGKQPSRLTIAAAQAVKIRQPFLMALQRGILLELDLSSVGAGI
jgi:hypothetical protein